jgi:hypothetical protein
MCLDPSPVVSGRTITGATCGLFVEPQTEPGSEPQDAGQK